MAGSVVPKARTTAMAKPKTNNEEAVSLFPFLSILACLIGVLTFIITGVAVSQMDQSEDLANVERAEKYGPLIQQIAADKEELEKLESTRNIQQRLDEQIKQEQARIDQAKKRILQQQNREQTRKEAAAIQQQQRLLAAALALARTDGGAGLARSLAAHVPRKRARGGRGTICLNEHWVISLAGYSAGTTPDRP